MTSIDQLISGKLSTIQLILTEYFTLQYASKSQKRLSEAGPTTHPHFMPAPVAQPSVVRSEPILIHETRYVQPMFVSQPFAVHQPAPTIINNNNNYVNTSTASGTVGPTPVSTRGLAGPGFTGPVGLFKEKPEEEDREEQAKKKEAGNDLAMKVSLGLAMAGLGFAGTYLAARDPYLLFKRSGIEEAIESLDDFCQDGQHAMAVCSIKNQYLKWRQCYLNRTRPTFYGKVGTFGSGILGLASVFVIGSSGFLGGMALTSVTGCYWLWSSLTARRVSEEALYWELIRQINQLHDALQIEPVLPIYPDLQYSAYSSQPLNPAAFDIPIQSASAPLV